MSLQTHTPTRKTPAVIIPTDEPVMVTKAASDWFVEHVRQSQSRMFATVETITPERATMLLVVNPDNRPLSERRIAEIIREISRDDFQCNGETIIVCKEGLLNDGQHRLTAIVRTGITIQSFVAWGVARSSRLTVDVGIARTSGNFLAMEGMTDTNRAASVAMWLLCYNRGFMESNQAGQGRFPTKGEVVSYALQHRDEIIDAIRATQKVGMKALGAHTAAATAYVLCRRADRAYVDEFFTQFCEGAGFEIGSPIHRLRTKLTENKIRPGHKLALILRVWNYWKRGTTELRSLQMPTEYPRIES